MHEKFTFCKTLYFKMERKVYAHFLKSIFSWPLQFIFIWSIFTVFFGLVRVIIGSTEKINATINSYTEKKFVAIGYLRIPIKNTKKKLE